MKEKEDADISVSSIIIGEEDNCEDEADPLELTMTGFSIDAIRNELARIKNHKSKVD